MRCCSGASGTRGQCIGRALPLALPDDELQEHVEGLELEQELAGRAGQSGGSVHRHVGKALDPKQDPIRNPQPPPFLVDMEPNHAQER
ncbi:uncharacterized protein RHO25_007358 [Cercospora beticola]|uniref:Uncharacterized protein n=1 Tax=Cercospora beticola TaxID=122368 RepID=A0ABZ0NT13_CERBT|nr:hypothetical protein RHO25_007358 [Cercospora beticola]